MIEAFDISDKIMGKKSSGIKQDADGFDLPSDEARAGNFISSFWFSLFFNVKWFIVILFLFFLIQNKPKKKQILARKQPKNQAVSLVPTTGCVNRNNNNNENNIKKKHTKIVLFFKLSF